MVDKTDVPVGAKQTRQRAGRRGRTKRPKLESDQTPRAAPQTVIVNLKNQVKKVLENQADFCQGLHVEITSLADYVVSVALLQVKFCVVQSFLCFDILSEKMKPPCFFQQATCGPQGIIATAQPNVLSLHLRRIRSSHNCLQRQQGKAEIWEF